MKVSVKRAFCTAMSAMLTLAGAAGLASCGDGGESDPNTLIIDAFEGGYGVDWLYAIADKFEEKNEGVSVDLSYGGRFDVWHFAFVRAPDFGHRL